MTHRRLLTLGLLALPAIAGDSGANVTNPNATLFPFGVWGLCESPATAGSWVCTGFQPGRESYTLTLKRTSPETSVFLWKVRGTRADGQVLTQSGAAIANVGGNTVVTVDFGAPVAGTQVEVVEK